MNLNKLNHLPEPLLTFGYNQKLIDPRDGITLFGPFDYPKVSVGNFGIIGTTTGIARMKKWLVKLKKPIYNEVSDIARPFFPGLEAAFGFDIDIDNLKYIQLDERKIDEYLNYTDSHQRVFNLVNLYAKELVKYKKEEEIPITVWFVVIPDQIYLHGRPKSKAPTGAKIKIGLKTKHERTYPSLFEEITILQEAYKYEINFHNQLKAKLLKEDIITQIIKESTVAYEEMYKLKSIVDSIRKFDTAKAWNIATTLYYKSGGLPWKLGSVRDGVCYIGLLYKKLNDGTDKNACCAAQMFLDSGDGLVFRGNVGPWYNPVKDEYHLLKEDAQDLLSKALDTFKKHNGEHPKEIFIHARTHFDDDEWEGFINAAAEKTKIVGVRITSGSNFKLFRKEKFAIPRGMAFYLNKTEGYLWTNGFVPRLETQMGLEVPNPLNIRITRGESDIETVCKDVLSLTKLNYNACLYGDGKPVTLRFADMIGEILTAGPSETVAVLPFKYYI